MPHRNNIVEMEEVLDPQAGGFNSAPDACTHVHSDPHDVDSEGPATVAQGTLDESVGNTYPTTTDG